MLKSGENYLETIYRLSLTNERVRSVDVAAVLGYSKPSVSRAIGLLKEQGLIDMPSGKSIVLTKEGLKQAKKLAEKQDNIQKFLMYTTDVDAEIAKQDAANIRYEISDKTYQGILSFIKQVEEYNE